MDTHGGGMYELSYNFKFIVNYSLKWNEQPKIVVSSSFSEFVNPGKHLWQSPQ